MVLKRRLNQLNAVCPAIVGDCSSATLLHLDPWA